MHKMSKTGDDSIFVDGTQNKLPAIFPSDFLCMLGPDTWWLFYPSASGGNQSPVDIITEEVRPEIDSTRPPLQISHNWSRTEVRKFSNTGTAARVNILNGASCKRLSIKGKEGLIVNILFKFFFSYSHIWNTQDSIKCTS